MGKPINLTGRKFERLAVLSFSHYKGGHSFWNVACDCGKEFCVAGNSLKTGNTKSCGCFKMRNLKPLTDLNGKTFTRLTVIKRDFEKEEQRRLLNPNAKNKVYWLCQCSCGNVLSIRAENLKTGMTKSCGCYNINGDCKASKTHGKSRTSEYKCWAALKDRCLNPKHKAYKDYGGRGIKVCERYLKSFESLYSDMGDKPTTKHTIDRINNDMNYSCGKCEDCLKNGWNMNVHWETRREQVRNTRLINWYEYNGKSFRYFELAVELNLPENKLRNYLKYHSVEQAIIFYATKKRQPVLK